MSSFDIDITRDRGRWTVHIREVDGPAQNRTISEAQCTARQMIALATGLPIDDIAVGAAGLAAPKTAQPLAAMPQSRGHLTPGERVAGGQVVERRYRTLPARP